MPNWTDGDAIALRTFLHDNPSFIKTLEESLPSIEGSTVEQAAITGSRHAGGEAIIKRIESMANTRTTKEKNDFIDASRD